MICGQCVHAVTQCELEEAVCHCHVCGPVVQWDDTAEHNTKWHNSLMVQDRGDCPASLGIGLIQHLRISAPTSCSCSFSNCQTSKWSQPKIFNPSQAELAIIFTPLASWFDNFIVAGQIIFFFFEGGWGTDSLVDSVSKRLPDRMTRCQINNLWCCV